MSVDCRSQCMYGGVLTAKEFEDLFNKEEVCAKFDWFEFDLWGAFESMGLDKYFQDDDAAYTDDYNMYYGVRLHNGYNINNFEEDWQKFEDYLLSLYNCGYGFNYDKMMQIIDDNEPEIRIFEHWY